MKQIFTLLSIGILCLASKSASAQYSQNFDVYNDLTTNCYTFDGFFFTTAPADVLTGAGSVYTNPPTGNSTREFLSPYINFASTALNVAFNYKLSDALNNNSERTIEIGIRYSDNSYALLQTINVTQTAKTSFNQNFNLAKTGVGKVVLRFSGKGNGASRFIIDDLYTSASPVYGTGTCNAAPSLTPDTYNAPSYAPYVATVSVLNNDTEPNGESMIVSLVSSTSGTVTFNANGTFTFIPNAGFTGTSATFTYRVTDNGYDVASSTSTVTIYFPSNAPIALPIKLLSFQGSVTKEKMQLTWTAADNETGNYFEVQKSTDGKKFQSAAMIFTTSKVGDEQYSYGAATTTLNGAFYRLKVVNKDNSVSYSKVIYLKANDAENANKVTLLQNPVHSSLSFSFVSQTTEPTEIAVYNMAGVKIVHQKAIAQKGSNTISIDMTAYNAKGNYVLKLTGATTKSTTKFIKY